MENKIEEILNKFNEQMATEPGTSNMGIPEGKFDAVAERIVKLFAIPDVSQQSEQLVNFLWEQYKIKRLITKKTYMQMVQNARKLTNCG